MMAEVRAGVSSCGSRLVLHAIVESEGGEVCGVVVERVSGGREGVRMLRREGDAIHTCVCTCS